MTIYNIIVPITTSYSFQIEAPEGMSRQQVMEMVTAQDIKEGEIDSDVWTDVHYSFNKEDGKNVEVHDEEFNEIEDN